MNGRIYDADTGRFMQADPFVQAPSNLQNYNRYSYVLNNPLSYTDPSGYLFKKLLKGAMQLSGSWYVYRFLNKNPLLRNLVNVGLNFAPGCTAWCSALFTGTSKFVESGSLGKAFKSGLTSYATAWAFSQIGDAFGAKAGFWKEGGIAHLGAHALTGGIISDVQGGNFGHGFWSAGLTKGAQVSGIVNMDSVVVGTAQSMVIAGTISKLTGGKFANAAVTGAFQYLYNAKGGNAGKGLFKAFKDLKRHFYGDDRTRQQKIAEYTQELMDDLHMPADKAYEQAKKFYSGNKNSLPKPPTGRGAVPADERDPKRLFTSSERTIKREQQNYQCANGCGTIIDANNSAGHHIIRWADGGPTVSENHAEVCTECHKSLHSRRKK
ncbi:DUF637 domain-containing protein [Pseudoalteromonas luteoviolacea]|uniref:RHS repeat-associated core domain-containing protein n=1 Tax=Pseudoalteromonas luteoviolacea TaxID=43657 RepID=UPI001B3A3E3F|nr:RHS repeat-associated core domain-containing protein [Pseudoalteromonas luteoviolacea]MBQ4880560.1 DUF637 domain-containing protein [Pseudoalteromonas luteoviolacea]MBQ4909594.1 DUF637 domain-containing protein [Pseudoalteromonas luteoviolacea]